MRTYQRGFIALMSAIIISAVLLITIVSGGFTGWNSRFSVFDSESKDRSAALADACLDTVLLRLAYDATYEGGETILLGDDSCEILAAQNPFGNPRVFPIQAVFNRAYTNVLVTIDIISREIISWEEIATL
ncbi:hypothetical protein A3I46_03020 [Candidatus Kaiserbacteria bacterium RIFCSPLOWO2_02_FULL_54_13]|uniref:Uncharacterized protein n=1 Tax=Candidatus Kaiserbacteria bacterium RIFCSPHIGHO2_02_FULL_54_22 TaxID=1798495 RepID=A0A1F6DNG2_9BACT|nr:MAG: hypothetical protein A3C19_02365 [Candidatus Kaiserbacteria bacterium RIFCSPHIGHO2_02_FULL_54_22]OGG68013.1 MAG: hypothetical protein A3E99_01860 [Candidatus Kaiserbacteria bacterium RIFCSPHIGHO2_12_FULL_54_16]OGG83525.1 MAG: hypothetical protein A3I46_03020 [Candidatus Kaiserbacteria bacterium RIFCSPLOWO2_02_FULL_54_13]OGG90072.1 MAG: hypothetical protein A3G12_00525 [Candidatus Kaiserbacteria bacterium RIFCSPLOWO2_12_FULL_54_10]